MIQHEENYLEQKDIFIATTEFAEIHNDRDKRDEEGIISIRKSDVKHVDIEFNQLEKLDDTEGNVERDD